MCAKKSKTTKTCPHCAAAEGTRYSLWDANDPFIQSFKRNGQHKNVELVNCPDCDQAWVLRAYGENNQTVDLSCLWGAEALEQFLNCSKIPLNASPAQLKVLAKIGGLNGDAYGNCRESIEVPCKVVLQDGREFDYCLLRFSKQPPTSMIDNKTHFWITAVAKILPSPQALPYEVRYLTSMAEEVRNSYAPSLIQAPNGKIFILNWTNQFFTTQSYAGSEFTVVKDKSLDAFNIPANKLGDDAKVVAFQTIVVYADWVDGLETKLLPK